MEEAIKLATQVVLLLTAVVGLFKLFKSNPGSGEKPKGSASPKAEGPFDFMISMLGVYGAVFVPILAMLAFMWVVKAMTGTITSKSPDAATVVAQTTTDIDRLPPSHRLLLVQYEIASRISGSTARDAAIVPIVQASLRERAYLVSLNSALGLANRSTRDEALSSIAEAAVRGGDPATAAAAIAKIGASFSRDMAAKKALRSLAGSAAASEPSSTSPAR